MLRCVALCCDVLCVSVEEWVCYRVVLCCAALRCDGVRVSRRADDLLWCGALCRGVVCSVKGK